MTEKTADQIAAEKARTLQQRAQIREFIIRSSIVAEPPRETLVATLVDARGFSRTDVIDVLDALLVEGVVKNVNGNIAVVDAGAVQPAALPTRAPAAPAPKTGEFTEIEKLQRQVAVLREAVVRLAVLAPQLVAYVNENFPA